MNREQALKIIQTTKKTYELIGSEFSDTRNRIWPEMELLVKQYIKIGDKILDIGCGNGRLVEVLGGVEYLGIDGSESLLRELKVKCQISNVKCQKLDMLELDKLEQKDFDVVFMFASFNHIPSEELRLKVLGDIKNLLKPGGLLIMTNWNMWQWGQKKTFWQYKIAMPLKKLINKNNWKLETLPIGRQVENWKLKFKDVMTVWQSGDKKKKGELYYRVFTQGELKRLFKKSGFKILENYYSVDGKKTCWRKGKNIVTVGQTYKHINI